MACIRRVIATSGVRAEPTIARYTAAAAAGYT